tara:strand:- start:247 stop:471 length:225 start_codon:yes stop_codon:yes gene_type:complete
MLVDATTNYQLCKQQGLRRIRKKNLKREVLGFGVGERQIVGTLLLCNCDQQTVVADSGNIDQTNVGKGVLGPQA